jgi:hypothetical protein
MAGSLLTEETGSTNLFTRWGESSRSEVAADKVADYKRYVTDLKYTEKYGTRRRVELQNGRIRYYGEPTPPQKPGRTTRTAYVHGYDPATGNTRGWMESYNASGDVIQVHPKHVNSVPVKFPHYMFSDSGEFTRKW